jgi:hypothetical protein
VLVRLFAVVSMKAPGALHLGTSWPSCLLCVVSLLVYTVLFVITVLGRQVVELQSTDVLAV